MNAKPDHHALYQTISDLIDYCRDNELPATEDMLTESIAILCQEESANNSLPKAKIHIFPTSHLTVGLS